MAALDAGLSLHARKGHLRSRALVASLLLALYACSSSDTAPLAGGGGGSTRGSGGGGGGNGSSDAGSNDPLASSVLGLLTFADTPTRASAQSTVQNQFSAKFLEGAYGDAGTGSAQIPAGCNDVSASVGNTTCRRVDCAGQFSLEPSGTPRSAGRLSLTGVVGVEAIDPNADGSYTSIQSGDIPLWQAGDTLQVSAAGDAVPAFTASVTAVPSISLVEPAATDGVRNLSRSVGFTFRINETVQTLRLALGFDTTLAGAARRVAFDCAAPGSDGTLTVPTELVSDLPDDARPYVGDLYGEVSSSVELGPSTEPIGRAIVSARRSAAAPDLAALDWTTFVVIP